jgi:hypothetical protein
MASPFDTFETFSKAEGAIYSFADKPWMMAVLLILVVLIGVWFIVQSYLIKH